MAAAKAAIIDQISATNPEFCLQANFWLGGIPIEASGETITGSGIFGKASHALVSN